MRELNLSPSGARAPENATALPAKRKKRRGGGGDHSFFDPLSDGSIRTAATRDRNSPPLSSPRIPKVHNIPIDVDLAGGGGGGGSDPAGAAAPKVRPKKFKYRVPLKLKKMDAAKGGGGGDPHNESAEVEAILAGLEDATEGKDRVMLQTGAYLEAARAINRCGAAHSLPNKALPWLQ